MEDLQNGLLQAEKEGAAPTQALIPTRVKTWMYMCHQGTQNSGVPGVRLEASPALQDTNLEASIALPFDYLWVFITGNWDHWPSQWLGLSAGKHSGANHLTSLGTCLLLIVPSAAKTSTADTSGALLLRLPWPPWETGVVLCPRALLQRQSLR